MSCDVSPVAMFVLTTRKGATFISLMYVWAIEVTFFKLWSQSTASIPPRTPIMLSCLLHIRLAGPRLNTDPNFALSNSLSSSVGRGRVKSTWQPEDHWVMTQVLSFGRGVDQARQLCWLGGRLSMSLLLWKMLPVWLITETPSSPFCSTATTFCLVNSLAWPCSLVNRSSIFFPNSVEDNWRELASKFAAPPAPWQRWTRCRRDTWKLHSGSEQTDLKRVPGPALRPKDSEEVKQKHLSPHG